MSDNFRVIVGKSYNGRGRDKSGVKRQCEGQGLYFGIFKLLQNCWVIQWKKM